MAPPRALRDLTLALGAAVVALGSLLFIAWKLYFRDTELGASWDSWWEREVKELRDRAPPGSTVRTSSGDGRPPGSPKRMGKEQGDPEVLSPAGWGRHTGSGFPQGVPQDTSTPHPEVSEAPSEPTQLEKGV